MNRTMLRSKIHRARVTATKLDYEGSIAIDERLLTAADILPHEEVHVLNINTGARFTTYAITGSDGQIELRGAAARLAEPGDIVIILTYTQLTDEEARTHMPRLVYVSEKNNLREVKRAIGALAMGD
jgi:aspartate 1-decarboxylase